MLKESAYHHKCFQTFTAYFTVLSQQRSLNQLSVKIQFKTILSKYLILYINRCQNWGTLVFCIYGAGLFTSKAAQQSCSSILSPKLNKILILHAGRRTKRMMRHPSVSRPLQTLSSPATQEWNVSITCALCPGSLKLWYLCKVTTMWRSLWCHQFQ